jgi:hypothetical protein
MPEWVIHNYTAENFCDISKNICDEINRFIDSNPLEHDVNRIIINGHWDPEALLYLAVFIYEKRGYNGLKCMLHHNLLDYAHKLASTGPYGAMIRRHAMPDYAEIHIKGLVYKVLDNIAKDFSPILKIFEDGGDPYDVLREIESNKLWRVEDLRSFLSVMKEPYIVNFLRDTLKAVNELRRCIELCVEEVIHVEFWHSGTFENLCPYCLSSTYREKEIVLVPEEYISKNLAFKIHRGCFERLSNIVRMILNKGFKDVREVIKEVMRETKSLPPSIIWEAVKRIRESQTHY